MEQFVMLAVGLIKFAFVIVLMIGWYPALKVKSKGGGLRLIKSFAVCIAVAVAMPIIGLSTISAPHLIRDLLFTADASLWGMLSSLLGQGMRGMSYGIGKSITSMSSFTAMGIVYCIIMFFFFRDHPQLWYQLWGKAVPLEKETKETKQQNE